MASKLKYTRSTTTSLKVTGTVDLDNGTIDVDGETKSITELLKDFNGAEIELSVTVKESEDLSSLNG